MFYTLANTTDSTYAWDNYLLTLANRSDGDLIFGDRLGGYGNLTGLEERGSVTAPQWRYLGLTVIPAWILFGNLLVLLAVIRQRNLRTLSNFVIASLAVTDFLLALVVVPLGAYQFINGVWEFGVPVCLLWTGMDVFLSTTSILHLCAIAINRYLAIAYPLRFRNNQSNCHIVALLTPAWIISFAISLPLIVHGALNNDNVLSYDPYLGLQCGIFYREFAIYSSVVSFFFPLAIMVFADIRSVQILRKNTPSPVTSDGPNSMSQNGQALRLMMGTSLDSEVESPFDTEISMSASVSQMTHFSSGVLSRRSESSSVSRDERLRSQVSTPTSPNAETVRDMFRSYNCHRVNVYNNSKFNSRERRAEKTLIWVFVCFVVLWLPFFCTNITYGICTTCDIPSDLFQAFTWLGYVSSGVNPCIYTYLNKDFRNAFRRILCCGRAKRRPRNSNITLYS